MQTYIKIVKVLVISLVLLFIALVAANNVHAQEINSPALEQHRSLYILTMCGQTQIIIYNENNNRLIGGLGDILNDANFRKAFSSILRKVQANKKTSAIFRIEMAEMLGLTCT